MTRFPLEGFDFQQFCKKKKKDQESLFSLQQPSVITSENAYHLCNELGLLWLTNGLWSFTNSKMQASKRLGNSFRTFIMAESQACRNLPAFYFCKVALLSKLKINEIYVYVRAEIQMIISSSSDLCTMLSLQRKKYEGVIVWVGAVTKWWPSTGEWALS